MNLFSIIEKNVVDITKVFPSEIPLVAIYLNPFTYIYFRKRAHELDGINGYRFDGAFMVFVLRLLRVEIPCRQSFDLTSLAPFVFQEAVSRELQVFFCGGTASEVELFSTKIQQRFPGLRVCGTKAGYFQDIESEDVITEIASSKPDLVILGLGGVKQERFASVLSKRVKSHIFTCGAFISQTASRTDYYPDWVKKHGFRWLYRFFREPRVILRVIRYYPLFLFYVFIDFMRSLKSNKSNPIQ